VKFGSNFQPFVRKRDVSHNDDEDMTREPEMVQAYRDTWELGLHSYLTYLRDRLLLSRDLLTPSGSIFVQISDENLRHVREVMDEVFGTENFVSLISVRKTGGATSETVPTVVDYLLWYAKDRTSIKYRPLFIPKVLGEEGATEYTNVELSDGTIRNASEDEILGRQPLPEHARIFTTDSAVSEGFRTNTSVPFSWKGITFDPGKTKNWKTSIEGMLRLCELGRILPKPGFRIYKRYFADFPFRALSNVWMDVRGALDRLYVVQTDKNVVERCLLMTTDPGDLVLDPTCGSGTTAHVAEQWGRRWITADTSRVPLALARQRLLTATFLWYELKDQHRGPAGGFTYKRKQNKKGEEVGGIVPHITLGSIANNEAPADEVLVDRPEVEGGITRVTGPFCFEATIPTPIDWEGDGAENSGAGSAETYGSFVDRMLEVLRKSPVLRLEGNKTVTFKNVRPPAKSLSLSAEALVTNGQEKPVALVFGPENGAVSEKLVYEAAKEANGKSYTHLYVVGFAIQPNARTLVEKCAEVMGVPATYVQATPDLMMGDLLKNMRSSQIFSVCGQPEIKVTRNKEKQYQVELLGLDVFDPITMEVTHRSGNDVPAWFLDTDYNDLCFHVSQAFFPRTSAWDNLKKALKGEYEESVWDHLSGTTSAPFEAGEHRQIAVKVIDDRGNELLVVKKLN
jgi:adenine-specific DNA-methyltransferase